MTDADHPPIAPRQARTINSGWRFHKGEIAQAAPPYDDSQWEPVNVPHTWNAQDAVADTPDYFRGICWYQKRIHVSTANADQRVFVRFEGANQDAVVFVNGREVGAHLGGYTAFALDATDGMIPGEENCLSVKLDNRLNPEVPPIGGDLCHFGGIYRNVWLIFTNAVHFDLLDHGSFGVYIDTPELTAENADVRVRGIVRNEGETDIEAVVTTTVRDPNGTAVKTFDVTVRLPTGRGTAFEAISDVLTQPSLWSPESPAVYNAHCTILDTATRQVLDEIVCPFGFRWVSVGADEGFYLNGDRRDIRGIGKHQDYDQRGYAVPDDVLREDVRLVKKMGANLLRAHYPQAPAVYEEMDTLGVMGWVKIAIMDKVAHTPQFHANTFHMIREMVLQNFNHPSVVMWGHACEILGDMDWYWPRPIDPDQKKAHLRETYDFSVEMENLTRELDPSRPTANDYHTDPNPQWYCESSLTDISMLNAWNIYMGWYHVNLSGIGPMMEETRAYNPRVGYMIAETGAGSDSRIHTHEPTIFDFSIEYQDLYTKTYLEEASKRPWCAGICFWTLVDFQVKHRRDTMPHINNKGVLRSDRTPKDAYYLLQANWSSEPMVHVSSRDWTRRVAFAERGATVHAPISIYSNQQTVELMLDGKSLGVREVHDGIAVFDVDFCEGRNRLEAVADGLPAVRDSIAIDFQFFPLDLSAGAFPEFPLCVNVGQSRTFFTDPLTGNTWVPDRTYASRAFGHVGGRYYRHWAHMPAWEGIREGVDSVILGTEIDPVFQTFLLGLSAYRLDVPDGEYELELYFVEPFSLERRMDPAEIAGAGTDGTRAFNVLVNGQIALESLDLAGKYGEHRAVIERFPVRVRRAAGVVISFQPLQGEPVLSGIKIRRVK